jgi:3-deoxy-D-manno-octulosonate 8-phosphate phosphatase (KDO 8-P phosphatase)
VVPLATKQPVRKKLRNIKLLLLDVDGVMTDGGLYFSEKGDELKKFNILDGYGIIKLRTTGVKVGIITGRISLVVRRRAEELGIDEIYQNLENKLEAYEQIRSKLGLIDPEIAYIGDDEPDIPVMKKVGFAACPSNAVAAVRREADFVCKCRGGEGAVREVIDLILGSHSHAA